MESEMENTLLILSETKVINLRLVIYAMRIGENRGQVVLGERGEVYDHLQITDAEFDVLKTHLKNLSPRGQNTGPR